MTDSWTRWPAPAKLNLFLHIVGRRDDGYHELQTVFQLLDWGDSVRIRVRADGVIEREAGAVDVAPERDLAVQAAQALRARCGVSRGADIAVDKRIPLGAGLGGGSSDAATVLVALNELWGTGLDEDALADIGLGLGADVPLFVRGRSAWAEGVGEKLTALDLPESEYLIVDPCEHVPTAALFQAPELTRNAPRKTIAGFLGGDCTGNVFAPVVCARYPQVKAAMDWLDRFGQARLSGSGGCVFVEVAATGDIVEMEDHKPLDFRLYRARGVNRSPLLDALDRFRDGGSSALSRRSRIG
ncbi:MAG: 4-(cytidine 5'-diphospho)-2-C-methyl-D-erythritol kinase [Rudaea sp.]